MLRDLLEHVGNLDVKSRLPMKVRVEQEPDHVYYLCARDGTLTRHEAVAPPRQHRAGDLSALINMVTRHAQQKAPEPTPAVLWYSRQAVILLLDDATRRDRLTLPLELHPQLRLLQELEAKRTQHDQKSFVALLRIQLAGCLGTAGNLLDVVRQVKFKQHQDGHGVVQHGKASVGRSIQSELTGAGTIPEETLLDVPVFHGPLAVRRYRIACAIEVDPQSERFQLLPFPGAVEAAVCQAEAALGDDLRTAVAEAAAVYYGVP